ncbi:APC family permease [Nocardia sp. NPDC051321]|uniref:APC family permease n=1 Tax=Nocardia sp. NPDC051321 TaxID=3364323 RepID=UPI00379EB347
MGDAGSKKLGTPATLAFAVSIVTGSGLLALPGQVRLVAGHGALWTWIIGSALMAAILWCLYRLETYVDGSSGIHELVQAGLGRRLSGYVKVLLISTFSVGIPGIALVTGGYIRTTFNWTSPIPLVTIAAVVGSGMVMWLGTKSSSRFQTVTSLFSLLIVVCIVAGALWKNGSGDNLTNVGAPSAASVSAVGIAFFAFAGWELVTFLSRDMRGGRGAYRAVLAASWLIVVGLYLLLVVSDGPSSGTDDTLSLAAPASVLGIDTTAIYALASLIMLASLFANLYGYISLISTFSTERTLPHVLSRPIFCGSAIAALPLGIGIISTVSLLGVFRKDAASVLFSIAGVNFLLIYLLACGSLLRLSRSVRERTISVVALGGGLVTLVASWRDLILAGAVFVSILIWQGLQHAKSQRHTKNELSVPSKEADTSTRNVGG